MALNDPLLREPDFDFAEFREWCETYNIKAEWIHFDFVKWLYSENNSRNNQQGETHGNH